MPRPTQSTDEPRENPAMTGDQTPDTDAATAAAVDEPRDAPPGADQDGPRVPHPRPPSDPTQAGPETGGEQNDEEEPGQAKPVPVDPKPGTVPAPLPWNNPGKARPVV